MTHTSLALVFSIVVWLGIPEPIEWYFVNVTSFTRYIENFNALEILCMSQETSHHSISTNLLSYRWRIANC